MREATLGILAQTKNGEKYQTIFSSCGSCCIDKKHVMIQAPKNSGSLFFNYKKYFSIVLLAVCDARYRFTLVDIGRSGRNSDSGIYATSQLGLDIDENLIGYPNYKTTIPGYNRQIKLPFVFLADEGFALKKHMMRPFPKNCAERAQIFFNYRLSRARRVIENSFGILASRFRIFRRPILAGQKTLKSITKASVALHNFLITEESNKYIPDCQSEILTPDEIQGLVGLSQQGSNNAISNAKRIRNEFKEYFSSDEGSVLWQNNLCNV